MQITILFDAYDDITRILDQLPTIDVYVDSGPPDAGPAAGGTYLFFAGESVRNVDLQASVVALATALKLDFASLEKASLS